MSSQMAEAIRQLQDNGYTKEQVLNTIESMLKAAYKRTFGTNVNAVVQFNDDQTDVAIYSRKVIVDGVYDPVTEIELEEAKLLSEECEIGDEIDILIDPAKEFNRSAVQTGKQSAHQSLSEIQKDSLYAEYKDKVGEIIIGYYQREKNGNIFVDLGKVEGILPAKNQSPREVFHKNDRIKALISELRNTRSGLQVVLSRTDPDFVRSIVELEVPEVYDKTVEIHKIVREPGYRTKIAVYSSKSDIDPVGSCVGPKGVRIQNVIKELEGEKVDILKYDPDPRVFIKNALSPAEVLAVVIRDEDKKQALAVVSESQFSSAIGKNGLNVRLANRLADWTIDVQREDQCEELDEILEESRKAAQNLFNNSEYEEITNLSDIEGISDEILATLKSAGIETIEQFDNADAEGKLSEIEGLSEDDIVAVQNALDAAENYEEESDAESTTPEETYETEEVDSDEEEYECPECGGKITVDMTVCPNCGIEISFEYEDEE
jgi:N utilization substance protein A